MDFADELKQLAKRVEALRPLVKTEEAAKVSLILPFVQLLGYDVFNPNEVVPEFTADVGTKKGEKVDYAIMRDGEPSILIEAKGVDDLLTTHDTQLFRYFSVTKAKFAVLTNGVVYRFYSDLQEANKLDEAPFLEIDLLNLKDPLIPELKKFHKENFDSEALFSDAANLKYQGQVKNIMGREFKEPSADFCRFFLREIQANKVITQKVMDRFQPLIKKALSMYVTELLNDKLKSALEPKAEDTLVESVAEQQAPATPEETGVVTTPEEIEGLAIVKSLLRNEVSTKRISLRDSKTRCAVLLDNNGWKWICRFYFGGAKKVLAVAKEDRSEDRIVMEDLDDIYEHQNKLVEAVRRHLAPQVAKEA